MNSSNGRDGPVVDSLFDDDLDDLGIPMPQSLGELAQIVRGIDLKGRWGKDADGRPCFFTRKGGRYHLD